MDVQAKKMGAKNACADLARRQEIQATKVENDKWKKRFWKHS